MDYFIIVVTTVAGLYFHWWIFWRIRRWVDRDTALAMAGDDAQKREYMLERLEQAKREKIRRKDLPQWLSNEAEKYEPPLSGDADNA